MQKDVGFNYGALAVGDPIVVSNDGRWERSRPAFVAKVKKSSIDAVIILPGGLEYRMDLWHEKDARVIAAKQEGRRIPATTRGVFKLTAHAGAAKSALKAVEALGGKIEDMQNAVKALAQKEAELDKRLKKVENAMKDGKNG
ncbi:hypothetical protein D6833_05975 [Candidatus Parcubacteria bacterium]|nr:MAG: hypothetical protein D6833_05975 [Candidatus Parcubacteria bacterium]